MIRRLGTRSGIRCGHETPFGVRQVLAAFTVASFLEVLDFRDLEAARLGECWQIVPNWERAKVGNKAQHLVVRSMKNY
jgi:hypothetical protein